MAKRIDKFDVANSLNTWLAEQIKGEGWAVAVSQIHELSRGHLVILVALAPLKSEPDPKPRPMEVPHFLLPGDEDDEGHLDPVGT